MYIVNNTLSFGFIGRARKSALNGTEWPSVIKLRWKMELFLHDNCVQHTYITKTTDQNPSTYTQPILDHVEHFLYSRRNPNIPYG